MALDQQEGTHYELLDTPNVAERAVLLWVSQRNLDASSVTTEGTTLANFLDGVNKGSAILDGYGSYILTKHGGTKSGFVGFIFGKPKTAEQAATAIRTSYDVESSYYWPPVLLRIEQYAKTDGTYTLKPIYKEAFSGPTRMMIEEFLSPTPHTIAVPQTMQPQSFDDVVRVQAPFDYSIGRLVLKECLHGAINLSLPLDPPVVDGALTYLNAFLYVPATNMTDWPATLVVEDKQREVAGGWLRRKVTAIKPS